MKSKSEASLRDLLLSLKYLPVALLLLAAALILDPIAHRTGPVKVSASAIEKDFHAKLELLERSEGEILKSVSDNGWQEIVDTDRDFIRRYAREDDGIALFLFKGDSLVFWSENSLVVETADLLSMEDDRVYMLPNCSVYTRIAREGGYSIVGVVFLKKFFPYNNELVQDGFLVGRKIPVSYGISIPPVPGALTVTDESGRYAFSVIPTDEVVSREYLHWITLMLYASVLLLILMCYNDLMRLVVRFRKSAWWLAALLADLLIIRWLLWYFRAPTCIFDLPLFKPFEHPIPFLDSRGDLILTMLFILFFAGWFSRQFELFPATGKGAGEPEGKRLTHSVAMLGWLIAVASFTGADLMIRYLLRERPGTFEIARILDIRIPDLLDSLVIVGIMAAFVLIIFRIINRIRMKLSRVQAVIGLVLACVLVMAFIGQTGDAELIAGIIFFVSLSGIILLKQPHAGKPFGLGLVTAILALISAYMVFSIDRSNREKESGKHLEMISRLSSEHDPIAEMLLGQIDPDIRTDSVLTSLVLNRNMNPDDQQVAITGYLKNRYFGLYWNRFEIQAYSCDPHSRTVIQPDNSEVGCLDFFLSGMRDKYGRKLNGTDGFYYLDNFDGVAEYLGVYDSLPGDPSGKTNLIVNIYSRFVTQELGYPELLITGKINRDSLDPAYSYAKYHLGTLQLTSGDYDYNLTSAQYPGREGVVVPFREEGYDHWIKRIDASNEIVISKPVRKTIDNLVTFSYVFVFFFFAWVILRAAMIWTHGFRLPPMGLKQRIQVTLVACLLFSFILIGGGMIWYTIHQYKQGNEKLIIEKTESLLADLQTKLANTEVLTKDWTSPGFRNLNELLIKFSYVFNTDMNLFDPSGDLVVSSRPEVFEYNLSGHKMNPYAFQALHHEGKPRFIQRESIESLGYYASYVPLYNQYNRLTGYLNLPYFSRQSETSREISTMVVAMVNAYFILILLAVFLAVLLARQVARPLELLQEKLAGVRFGGKNQMIAYHRQDEIGKLVGEYNRMVDELQASAEKLARSERESAWREMARQIAHEIKNPLTPMKLSVQHLRKAWKDGVPDLDTHIDRMTSTLVDQIETLSNIANEFSKFAQFPGAHFEPVDLMQKIQRIGHLFGDTCRIDIRKDPHHAGEVPIHADPEQINQVFNNLIKNAMQAVAEGTDPVVVITVRVADDKVVVQLTDNGEGIPEELREKLFEPNFTTKTSGMGLGLAITKKIMEGSGGKIWFETEDGKGTSFFLEWPLYQA